MEVNPGKKDAHPRATETRPLDVKAHAGAKAVVISWPHKEARHDVDVEADTGIVEAHSVNLDTGPSHRSQGGSPWRL
jgi:hypothetical protein